MPHTFTATLHRLEGKIAWTVFYVPFSVPDVYGTNGRFEVKAVIDGHPFRGTLLPSRNGHYLPFNQAMKTACKKELGDSVHVVMEPDAEPRTVAVPEDVGAALAADPAAKALFEALPDYWKREQITKITSAKQPETRARRICALLKLLPTVRRLRGSGGG
jgi:hypothetical protein